jgi:hypothetical protein
MAVLKRGRKTMPRIKKLTPKYIKQCPTFFRDTDLLTSLQYFAFLFHSSHGTIATEGHILEDISVLTFEQKNNVYVFLMDNINSSTCLLKTNINLHVPLFLIAATITLLNKTYRSTSPEAQQYYLLGIREN